MSNSISFSFKPRNLIRQLIKITYESNINQFNHAEGDFPEKLKFIICNFILDDDIYTDEYIDRLVTNMADNDEVKISNSNEFRLNLWNNLIKSKEFKEYISDTPILDSSVFDKSTKKEYPCDFGEHFLGIYSALFDSKITGEENQNKYITENILLFGQFSSKRTNIRKDINYAKKLLTDDYALTESSSKIKPLSKDHKIKIIQDYTDKFWINISQH